VDAARAFLDRLGVPARLEHIRDFLWRGGEVTFEAQPGGVAYVLAADWETAVLDDVPSAAGLLSSTAPVVVGRWRRARTGYRLRVGIDHNVLTAISIQALRLRSYVPFVGRAEDEVAHALDERLAEYGRAFLDECSPVPQAMAADARRLRDRGV
jgi:hypothetical protein